MKQPCLRTVTLSPEKMGTVPSAARRVRSVPPTSSGAKRTVPIFFLALLFVSTALAQPFDILLKGGHVIDPANEIDRVMDVAVKGGTIARVAEDIPAEQAKKTIDVSGYYVTPGLVDIHTHVFGYQGWIWPDDTHLTEGVTTIADCGGAGWRTFDEFKETVIDRAKTRVFAFINIVGKGMVGGRAENDVTDMDADKTAEKIEQYPDVIVGIKTAHFARKGYLPLERAVEAGTRTNTPVIVDMQVLTHQARDTKTKLLEILRPGDIHTHMNSDRQLEMLNRATREIQPWMWKARKRGIIFDVGHGGGAFIFPTAADSMRHGFPPDTLSSDLHNASIVEDQTRSAERHVKVHVLRDELAAGCREVHRPPRPSHQEVPGGRHPRRGQGSGYRRAASSAWRVRIQ